jgi:hypothetical protein
MLPFPHPGQVAGIVVYSTTSGARAGTILVLIAPKKYRTCAFSRISQYDVNLGSIAEPRFIEF